MSFAFLAMADSSAHLAFADSLHTEDALTGGIQRPVFQSDSTPEISRLQKQVLDAPNPGSLAWWTAAQNFAAKVPESQARAFAGALPEGARRNQFLELLRVKSIPEAAKLRAAAQASLLSPAREAAAKELSRREANPDARAIESIYKLGWDESVDVAENLAIGDENFDAEVFARLVGSLNSRQRAELLENANTLSSLGASDLMTERIRATIRIAEKKAIPTNEFEQKFADRYGGALVRNVAFNQTALAAAQGDSRAKARLREEVSGNLENTRDYIDAQRASGNEKGASALLNAVRRSP